MAFLAGIANGISGCIGLSLPAMVAATWFPLNERTTATGKLAIPLNIYDASYDAIYCFQIIFIIPV